ncbi:Acetylornithine deacetylase [Nymphaea thermarum]|nr:Acetylornithine deacetylase [Nymphaea thermarum]
MGGSLKEELGVLDGEPFVSLLSKLIGESRYVQNNPPELVPQEDRVVSHLLDALAPYSKEQGGPLLLNHASFVEGRGNLIVEYPGTVPGKVLSFVGSHMDVVTANPDDWDFDPFSLSVEGDKLRGRGTTDCLGHVALLTELMKRLAQVKPTLKCTVVAVFIANEENSSILGVGVDALVTAGLLNKLKDGPLFWIDTADKQPCIGTGGMIAWKLRATGKLFHSGLPHKTVNPLELAMEALKEIQSRFYRDFPPHPMEKVYGFATPSTMKPTQWTYPGGGVNQIPAECTISGDCSPDAIKAVTADTLLQASIPHLECCTPKLSSCKKSSMKSLSSLLLSPFLDMLLGTYCLTYGCIFVFSSPIDVAKKLEKYVDEINNNIEKLDTRGPVSKYVVPEENLTGRLHITFDEDMKPGVACSLDSLGYHVLCKATEEVVGYVKPYSITGSLPLIRELQDEGFDVQTAGYGLMSTYHAKNEYCLLPDMEQGFRIFVSIISRLEEAAN